MKTVSRIREEYIQFINNHREEMIQKSEEMRDDLEHSALFVHGKYTCRPLSIPRIYSKEMIAQFEEIVKTAYGIFNKIIKEYLTCPDYRELFPFSKELEELILVPNGYASYLPMSRFDIFYNEETGEFHFCEINADGSTGMNEDRITDEMMIHNPAHQEVIRHHDLKTFELLDSLADTILGLYATYENRVEKPNVAIVDFLDMGTFREFEEMARRFQRKGVNSEICDIRELRYENGKLLSPAGHVIDAIYRRAVTADVMDHYEEIRPFIQAVKDRAVFISGAFCTQLVHHKSIFHVIHLPRTMQFLTEKEQEFVKKHVPNTVPFDENWIEKETVKAHKDAYILKPQDAYASKGVAAGFEYEQAEWDKLVEEAYGNDYICQDFVPQYYSVNIDFAFGDAQWHEYTTMAGLYVYNGKFAGVFSRAARKGEIIDYINNERRQVTYVIR